MKLVTYILSIYVLLLAVIPCQCEEEVYVQIQHTAAVAEFHSANNCEGGMQKSNVGICSPFCADAIVHSFSLYTTNYSPKLPKLVAIIIEPQTVYHEAVLQQTYARGVWRPPVA